MISPPKCLRLGLVPFTVRIGLLALVFAAACDGAPQPPGADLSRGSGGATSPVTARGVELRVPIEGGDVVFSADSLTLGGERGAALEGDVRLRSEGAMPFEATAARATIADGGRVAALEGGVRAVLAIGSAGLDAGATRD